MKMFNRCIKEEKTYFAVLNIAEDSTPDIEFFQNSEFRIIDLLSVSLQESDKETIRSHV